MEREFLRMLLINPLDNVTLRLNCCKIFFTCRKHLWKEDISFQTVCPWIYQAQISCHFQKEWLHTGLSNSECIILLLVGVSRAKHSIPVQQSPCLALNSDSLVCFHAIQCTLTALVAEALSNMFKMTVIKWQAVNGLCQYLTWTSLSASLVPQASTF